MIGMKSLSVTIFLFFSLQCFSSEHAYQQFKSANYGHYAGDMGSLYQVNNGFFYTLINNDWLGNTDKHMTSKSVLGLSYTGNWYSLSLSSNWRVITPATKIRFNEPLLSDPVGIFAEWSETTLSQAITLGLLKFQVSYSYSDLDNHGMGRLQEQIHDLIDSNLYEAREGYEVRGNFESWGGELGLILPISQMTSFYLAGGTNNSEMMEIDYLQANLLFLFSKNFTISMEYKRIKQKHSEFYDNSLLKPYRNEAGLGIKINDYWRIAFRYVSSYLEGDHYRQIFFDPITINIKF